MTRRGPGFLSLIMLVACGGSDEPSPPSAPLTEVEGAIRAAADDAPIAGATICARELDACTTTDAGGAWRLGDLPSDQDLTITYEAEGFLPYAVMVGAMEDHPRLTTAVLDATSFELSASLAGSEGMSEGAGAIIATARKTAPDEAYEGQPGVTMVLGDDEATYLSVLGLPAGDEATTKFGSAWFFEVEAGEHEIRFDHSGGSCSPYHAWAGEEPSALRVRVDPGTISFVSMRCP